MNKNKIETMFENQVGEKDAWDFVDWLSNKKEARAITRMEITEKILEEWKKYKTQS